MLHTKDDGRFWAVNCVTGWDSDYSNGQTEVQGLGLDRTSGWQWGGQAVAMERELAGFVPKTKE